jgi:hypothetical protein
MATTLPSGAVGVAGSITHPDTTNAENKVNFSNLALFLSDLFGTSSDIPTAHAAFKNYGISTLQNANVSTSVAAGALTIALKTAAATDPSATDPVLIAFRSATAGTGAPSLLAATAAQSLVLPSGATMGASSGVPFALWLVEFNDAGTLRLGAVNCLNGTAPSLSIYPLRDNVLASSTLVSTGADSAHVIYTGSAVATKAMRVLARLEWTTGLTNAGVWDANPTKIQMFGPGQSLPGERIQRQRSQSGAVATGTTIIPGDDTIPQITEGDQYFTVAITPTSVVNVLSVEAQLQLATSAGSTLAMIAALFQDATANALAAAEQLILGGSASRNAPVAVSHTMRAGTASSTTLRARAGASVAGTTTLNGTGGARLYGGVLSSHLTVEEIQA